MRIATGKNVCTGANHVWSPSELLTVKNKSLPVFVKFLFVSSALCHKSLDAILLFFNLLVAVMVVVVILGYVTVVGLDFPGVMLDALL